MTSLVDDLVPAELWAIVKPLLGPTSPAVRWPAPRCSDRNCFAAIVFMARLRPRGGCCRPGAACGSPATCWRRLTEWAKAGVFDQLHLGRKSPQDRLGQQGVLDWTGACVDTAECARRAWGDHLGANPVDPGQAWKLAPPGLRRWRSAADPAIVTAANVNDTTMFQALLDEVPAAEPSRVGGGAALGKVYADKSYDSAAKSCLSATAWDHRTTPAVGLVHRPGWVGIVGGGRAVAVMVGLLAAAAGRGGTGTRSG